MQCPVKERDDLLFPRNIKTSHLIACQERSSTPSHVLKRAGEGSRTEARGVEGPCFEARGPGRGWMKKWGGVGFSSHVNQSLVTRFADTLYLYF